MSFIETSIFKSPMFIINWSRLTEKHDAGINTLVVSHNSDVSINFWVL